MKKNLKKKGRENLPFIYIIGQGGFEPPTPWSRTKCASLCATIRQHLRVYVKERHLSIEDGKERL